MRDARTKKHRFIILAFYHSSYHHSITPFINIIQCDSSAFSTHEKYWNSRSRSIFFFNYYSALVQGNISGSNSCWIGSLNRQQQRDVICDMWYVICDMCLWHVICMWHVYVHVRMSKGRTGTIINASQRDINVSSIILAV